MPRIALYVLPVVLVVYAFVDCLINRDRPAPFAPRWVWLIAIVVVPVAGPIGWLLASRLIEPPRRPASRPRAVAPDDDPDFLRDLGRRTKGQPPVERDGGHHDNGSHPA